MRIAYYVPFGGLGVPVSENHKYLGWTKIEGNEAPPLESPYDIMEFKIGTEEAFFVLEYVKLPGDHLAIETSSMQCEIHCEDKYVTVGYGEAMEVIFAKIEKIINSLKAVGVEHDIEFSASDPWYFMRAVGYDIGVPQYANMDNFQQRGY